MRQPKRRPKGHQRSTASSKASAAYRPSRSLPKAVVTAIVVVGLLMGGLLAFGVYANELLDLVGQNGPIGNPSMRLEDIVEPDDYVDKADNPQTLVEAQKGYDAIQKIAVRSDKDVYNILLVGNDQQAGEKIGSADAMMILTINKKTKQFRITTLIRSMYVKIPGKGWSMLSHAFTWGGAKLLLQTVADNFRIRIDDYAVIDFSGFEKAINLVGGIEIPLTEQELIYLRQNYPHYSVKAGTNKMNGEIALAYSRILKIDSDYVRAGRQQRVIDVLMLKVKTLPPRQINDMVFALFPLTRTNLSKAQMLTLLADSYEARSYPNSRLMLPIEKSFSLIVASKTQMLQFDLQKNVAALHQFIFSTPD